MASLDDLRSDLARFAKDRDWEQFHTAKNLSAALSVEASELLENFMWLTPAESVTLNPELRSRVIDEVGDVLICLLNFCNALKIDPLTAAAEKLKKNEEKYPVEKARGNAKKYDDL